MVEPVRPGSGGLGRAQDIRSTSGARPAITIHGPFGTAKLTQGSALQIGRQPKNDIVLEGPTVSRHHATIVWLPDQERPTVEDLASANGTIVDGKPVRAGEPCVLPDCAIVEIGEHKIGIGHPVPGAPPPRQKTGTTPQKTSRPDSTMAAHPTEKRSPTNSPSGVTSRPTERLPRQPNPDSRHDGIGYVSFGNKKGKQT